jgi:hypothetical protein
MIFTDGIMIFTGGMITISGHAVSGKCNGDRDPRKIRGTDEDIFGMIRDGL